jgi:alpha-L-rhamnosidase
MRRLLIMATMVVGASLGLLGAQGAGMPGVDEMRRLFVSPPDDSRIMMRWWWFGPAVTEPELEREMRAMKEGGIGGFEVQPVYPVTLDDKERGIKNLLFLSDEFLDALKFTAETAHTLGLRMDLTLGSGWPYGGPTIPIDLAAGRLRYEHVALAPGMRRVPLPAIGAGERLIGVFTGVGSGTGAGGTSVGKNVAPEAFDAGSLHALAFTADDIRDGSISIPSNSSISSSSRDAGTPATYVLFFISSRTGMMVKRPALGAEGFVLDHYDRAAIDRYLDTVGTPLLRALQARPPYAIFCDSLEVFQSDWTADLLDQFKTRRGYDLTPHLPALVANVGADTASIRRDWGKTLTELVDERFLTPLHAFARSHGTKLRLQGYGVPPATVSSDALADLPEGEGWQWKQLQATRWAASASHIYGRPVTSSETWTWLHSPVFRATPLDIKAEADLHFLQGINQLIGHGWPYTAAGVDAPGWRFYAAGVFNDQNPWWLVMPDLARYLQRVSFMLRQGEPANDVALYLPTDDAWARITGGRAHLLDGLRERLGPDVVASILAAGFNLDVVDDAALAYLKIGASGSGSAAAATPQYRVIVLPGVETIPVDTLKQLDAFSRAGGIVIATRRLPDRAPGFRATDADHQQVRELSARVKLVQDEKTELPRVLASLTTPDLAIAPATAAADIGFIHRHTSDADIYFIANTSNERQRVTATVRAAQKMPAASIEIWNPLDGTMTPAPAATAGARGTVALDLDPYASRLIIVSTHGKASSMTGVKETALPPIDISSGWMVSFGPQSRPQPMDHLHSWIEDDATRDFSGVATYEKTVQMPKEWSGAGRRVLLDFGESKSIARDPNGRMQAWLDAPVREAAVVFVDDRRVGSVWCPPYALDVTAALRPGEHHLRIQVANLALNHMASRALPDYHLLNLRYGVRFEPQDMDKVRPVPAGLLGPIRLLSIR